MEPVISPDGKHIAYWRSSDKKKWQLVMDGNPLRDMVCDSYEIQKIGPVPDGNFQFNPKSKGFFCVIRKHQLYYLFVDGNEVDSAVGIVITGVSPDGKRLAYWKLNDGEKWQLILDGKPLRGIVCDSSVDKFYEGSNFPRGNVDFSPDGKRFLCKLTRNGKEYLYSEKGLLCSARSIMRYEFSPDGTRVAYTWSNDGPFFDNKSRIYSIVDGKKLFSGSRAEFWAFSPDSKNYAVLKLGKFRNQVYVNDKPVGSSSKHFTCYPHRFSSDSRHLIYYISSIRGRRRSKQFVIDGKRTVPMHNEILTNPVQHKDPVTYWVADYAHGDSIDSGTTIKFVRVKLKK
jgi:Tol biopolymer transport system component